MKYPFRPMEYAVCEITKKGERKWTVKSIEYDFNSKGDMVTTSQYRFPCFDTEEETLDYYEKMKNLKYLATSRKIEYGYNFKQYYGCTYCADALTSKLKPLTNDKEKVMFCSHKKCPYAEEIESQDGFVQMLMKMREEGLYNLDFTDVYFNKWFGR